MAKTQKKRDINWPKNHGQAKQGGGRTTAPLNPPLWG
jgi:hypothetical protein